MHVPAGGLQVNWSCPFTQHSLRCYCTQVPQGQQLLGRRNLRRLFLLCNPAPSEWCEPVAWTHYKDIKSSVGCWIFSLHNVTLKKRNTENYSAEPPDNVPDLMPGKGWHTDDSGWCWSQGMT